MLLNMEPPVGFGRKCPKILAYRRLIRMNMPVDENGTVHFTTTLFALIRESLGIKMLSMQDATESDMDRADDELRETVKKLWPFQSINKIDLAIPPKDGKYTQIHLLFQSSIINTLLFFLKNCMVQ